MANRPPSGPRFQIPTVARPPPPQPRPRPPLASAVPTPFRQPPPSPRPPAPQIPTNGITTSNSSPKSTANPDSVAPSSSSDKKSPPSPRSSSRGDITNAYSANSQTTSSPAANAISRNVNVVPTSPDHGESIIAPPPSPFKLPPPLLMTTAQENHDQPSLLTTMEGAKHKNETSPAAENSKQQQQQHYYTTIQKGNPELINKDKGGILKKQHSEQASCSSSIVTLAGENRGATMEFGKHHKKTTDCDNGGGQGTNKKGPMDHGYMINSNVQGVNNSIVYGSSYAHNDPGVHLQVLRKRN